jgi:hypothetical protein
LPQGQFDRALWSAVLLYLIWNYHEPEIHFVLVLRRGFEYSTAEDLDRPEHPLVFVIQIKVLANLGDIDGNLNYRIRLPLGTESRFEARKMRACSLWLWGEYRQLSVPDPSAKKIQPCLRSNDSSADSIRLSFIERPEQCQPIPRIFNRLAESKLELGLRKPD